MHWKKLNVQCAGLECASLVLPRHRLALHCCWGRDTGDSGSWGETGDFFQNITQFTLKPK